MCSPLFVTQTAGLRRKLTARVTLGDKWIKWCVTKDPEQNHHNEKRPDIFCGNEKPRLRTPGDSASGAEKEHDQEKRQRKHHQRIKLERGEGMPVKQLMQTAQRAAARTLKAG